MAPDISSSSARQIGCTYRCLLPPRSLSCSHASGDLLPPPPGAHLRHGRIFQRAEEKVRPPAQVPATGSSRSASLAGMTEEDGRGEVGRGRSSRRRRRRRGRGRRRMRWEQVRRNRLVEDAFTAMGSKETSAWTQAGEAYEDAKSRRSRRLTGSAGVDWGGLQREFFTVLGRELFDCKREVEGKKLFVRMGSESSALVHLNQEATADRQGDGKVSLRLGGAGVTPPALRPLRSEPDQ
eukprot:115286-Hanusia_phi.AAC.1